MRINPTHVRSLLIAARNKRMMQRSWLLEAFTVFENYTHEVTISDEPKVDSIVKLEDAVISAEIPVGDFVRINKSVIGLVIEHENGEYTVDVLCKNQEIPFNVVDSLEAVPGVVAEIFPKGPLTSTAWGITTVGRFLLNMVCLQYATDFVVFPYKNTMWKSDKISDMISKAMQDKRVTVEQYEHLVEYTYFLCHITEICVPSFTEKSILPAPGALAFRDKFIKEHADQLDDPVVIQQMEEQLIKMDKEYLEGDPSKILFDGLGSKSYTVQRKKLFYTVGGIAPFGASGGKVDFIKNSLSEGWTIDSIPSRANEIRKGSYNRGVETAKGGAETKAVFRAFGDLAITEDDCGTKRTITVDCSKFDGSQFIGRTIQVNGSDIVVTNENLDKYVTGKVIHLYSPMTCETKKNLCYKCCGKKTRELNAKYLGSEIIKITSAFLMISMKNMHGTALQVRKNKFADVLL